MKEKNNISKDLLQFIKIVNELISTENNEPVFKEPEQLLKSIDISLVITQLMIQNFIKS